jgi:hypothetical protein
VATFCLLGRTGENTKILRVVDAQADIRTDPLRNTTLPTVATTPNRPFHPSTFISSSSCILVLCRIYRGQSDIRAGLSRSTLVSSITSHCMKCSIFSSIISQSLSNGDAHAATVPRNSTPPQLKKIRGLSPQVNYTDRATDACRRS